MRDGLDERSDRLRMGGKMERGKVKEGTKKKNAGRKRVRLVVN